MVKLGTADIIASYLGEEPIDAVMSGDIEVYSSAKDINMLNNPNFLFTGYSDTNGIAPSYAYGLSANMNMLGSNNTDNHVHRYHTITYKSPSFDVSKFNNIVWNGSYYFNYTFNYYHQQGTSHSIAIVLVRDSDSTDIMNLFNYYPVDVAMPDTKNISFNANLEGLTGQCHIEIRSFQSGTDECEGAYACRLTTNTAMMYKR